MKIKLFDDKGKELDIQPITQKLDSKDKTCYLISLPMGETPLDAQYRQCEALDKLLAEAGVEHVVIMPIRNKNQRPIIQKLKITKKKSK